MDDAGGGRRGTRASMSADLLKAVERSWGLVLDELVDLGGSVNLNVRVSAGSASYVVRVYRPSVDPDRLAYVQRARTQLRAGGVPCTVALPTLTGGPWILYQGRLVELETFVPAFEGMNTIDRIERGLPTLGRCHSLLAELPQGPEPAFANYVSAGEALAATKRAARRVRSWSPTPAEVAVADDAERLAARVSEVEDQGGGTLQLVHGDFWDNNVLFDDAGVALVADLDFAGFRPRVDDLALTLYFTSVDITDLADDPARLKRLVDAYDAGADEPLSEGERLQIPAAMARQPLWSLAVWVAMLDDTDAARAHLRASASEIRWGLEAVTQVPRLRSELTS